MNKIKHYAFATSLASLLLLTGCTPASHHLVVKPTPKPKPARYTQSRSYEAPTPQKMALYEKTMRRVAAGIKDDPYYQKIVLNTQEKKAWFKTLTYRLWDRQITRHEFMREGLSKYPQRRYEFQFIIDGFTKVCH